VLIEIVTHCYAAELPHYADALCYQLSSLILHKPNTCDVRVTVCLDMADDRTWETVGWFLNRARPALDLKVLAMTRKSIGRRCIGRNSAARTTEADIVWFADCDQVYRDGCLDRLAGMEWPDGAAMIYPREIMISRDHATGQAALGLLGDGPRLIDVDPGEFAAKRYRKAIGGVQIVQGDFAREHGYLDGDSKWQRPRTDGKPFADFRDDLAYRRYCQGRGEIVGVDLPGMYRIRHEQKTHPD